MDYTDEPAPSAAKKNAEPPSKVFACHARRAVGEHFFRMGVFLYRIVPVILGNADQWRPNSPYVILLDAV